MAPRTDLNENFERGGILHLQIMADNGGGGGNQEQFSIWSYGYSLDSSLCSISLSHAPLCTLARSPW